MYTKYVCLIEMDSIMDLIPYKREKGPVLDFEKIIPMPEDFFTIESDSDLVEDFEYIHFVTDLAKTKFEEVSYSYNPCIDKTRHALELFDVYEKDSKEMMLDGMKFGENLVKYGAASRRDWRLAYWGCISTGLHYTPLSGIHLGIVTLGGRPMPVIRKLSTLFPGKGLEMRTFSISKSGSIDIRILRFGNGDISGTHSLEVNSLEKYRAISWDIRKFISKFLNED